MELTPPLQHRRNTVRSSKTNSKYGNNKKVTAINYRKDRNAEMYRPPTDVLREKMIDDLSREVSDNNNGNNVLPLNSSLTFGKVSTQKIPFIEPSNSTSISTSKVDARKFSYTSLSSLRRRRSISYEEYIDAKAVKAGFRNQYERVLTRYSEALKLLKSHSYSNEKEKSKLVKKIKGMEKYLKESEKIKNKCT